MKPIKRIDLPPYYRHQRLAIRTARELDGRCGIFMGVGTGKTRVAIRVAATYGKKILVVGPLMAIGVWRAEVRKWMPQARTVSLETIPVQARAAKLRRIRRLQTNRTVFVLVGYESYWRKPLRQEIERYAPAAIIYDEAHRLKERGAKQSRFAHALASESNKIPTPSCILPLTGTPSPNGHQDIFSVFKTFAPSVFGPRWPEFVERYIVYGGYMDYEIKSYKNEDELAELVAAHSIRVTKEEALDLPPEVDVNIPIKLSTKSRRVYDAMADDAIAEIDSSDGSGVAISRITLTNQIRLSQMTSGFVTVDDGRELRFGTEKRDALRELLSDIILDAHHVVVWARFTNDIETCLEVAREIVGDEQTFRLDGKVAQKKRHPRIKRWRRAESGIIVAHPKVAGEIIDLSAASADVFYSKDWSLLSYDQARGRVHRSGQTRKVTHYHLTCIDTVDRKIMAALKHKRELSRRLLDRKRARKFFRVRSRAGEMSQLQREAIGDALGIAFGGRDNE